jgi:hypothetical protein
MQPVIPLTGSDVAGPLGVVHLPRLWQKAILSKTGLLTERRYTDPRGFDVILTAGLGVNLRSLHRHFDEIPTYMQTERWVLENATRSDPGSIAKINEKIVPLYDNLGVWNEFHTWLTANRATTHDAIVPAISSRTNGPLGLNHLARLWVSMLLDALDLLPNGYRCCGMRIVVDEHGWRRREPVPPGPDALDIPFLDEFGVDVEPYQQFVKARLPTYQQFEDYFKANARKFGTARIAPFNALRINARPEKAAAMRAAVGLDDPSVQSSYLLNDLEDWQAIHAIAGASGTRPAPPAPDDESEGRRRR